MENLFDFLCFAEKLCESKFQPANEVQSTCLMVKIFNNKDP